MRASPARDSIGARPLPAVAQADICAVAAGVVGACSAFVRAAALEGVRDGPLRQKAGAAMERCAAAERAPLDDRTALSRALMQARDVQDTMSPRSIFGVTSAANTCPVHAVAAQCLSVAVLQALPLQFGARHVGF